MALTAIEIIALIMIALGVIKCIVFLINAKSWYSVVKTIYGNPRVTIIVGFILAAVVLWYLLEGGLSIVQIFAAMTFTALLMMISFALYSDVTLPWIKKMLADKKILWKSWWLWLIWIALFIWAIKEIFF